jgi:crossover junction endodeoxyribonuclease RusA
MLSFPFFSEERITHAEAAKRIEAMSLVTQMKINLNHLPDPDLSPNKRLHWSELSKAKDIAKDEAKALVLQQGRPAHPYERAHITITWVAKDKRRRDVDNLLASMKSYIDGLVGAGLIADDSAKNVSYTIRYEQGEKDDTVIEVEEGIR